jgi:hypothetical protein
MNINLAKSMGLAGGCAMAVSQIINADAMIGNFMQSVLLFGGMMAIIKAVDAREDKAPPVQKEDPFEYVDPFEDADGILTSWLNNSQVIVSGHLTDMENGQVCITKNMTIKGPYSNERVDYFMASALTHHIRDTSKNEDERYQRMVQVENLITNPNIINSKSTPIG